MFWDCCLISKVWFKLKTNTLSKRVKIKLMEMGLKLGAVQNEDLSKRVPL